METVERQQELESSPLGLGKRVFQMKHRRDEAGEERRCNDEAAGGSGFPVVSRCSNALSVTVHDAWDAKTNAQRIDFVRRG